MTDAQRQMVKTIIGTRDVSFGIAGPVCPDLVFILWATALRAHGQIKWRGGCPANAPMRRGQCGHGGHVLEMCLADKPGAISGPAQDVCICRAVQRQGNAVLAAPVHGGQLAGGQCGAVGLANRVRDIELVETGSRVPPMCPELASSQSGFRSTQGDRPAAGRS